LLLRSLGQSDLVVQESSGLLLLGQIGEKIVNNYNFYAAFQSEEEFRLVENSSPLGTLPISQMLTIGQRIMFAGKSWLVNAVDEPHKTIYVTRKAGGQPPLFLGPGCRTHTHVVQRMRKILNGQDVPIFLDATAKRFLAEGQSAFKSMNLSNLFYLDQGLSMTLLTWMGDDANDAIACTLNQYGFTAASSGPGVEVGKGKRTTSDVLNVLFDSVTKEAPSLDALLEKTENLIHEKWDWALPDALLRKNYASHFLDLVQARQWIKSVKPQLS
jgi:ATP-dependent Lhr-like helicase